MTSSEKQILVALAKGEFVVSLHALERMLERGVLEVDIRNVGKTCRAMSEQNHGTWQVQGVDTHGRCLNLIIAAEDELILVTVFGEKE